MNTKREDYRKYLKPELISKLSHIELKARMVVEGFLVGLHKSPYHGFSAEFSEYRQYNPGDSIKYLDWKAYGKTDRFYIKKFEEETNVRSYILLDKSGSMTYSSRKISKLEYGSYIAAALAYLMNMQKDATGLYTFDTELRDFLPPSTTKLNYIRILKMLEDISPGGETDLSETFISLAAKIKKRSLILIISDLLDDPDRLIKAIKHFKYKENEVIIFHLLDPDELEFGFQSETIFEDLETDEKIQTLPWQIRESYQRSFTKFLKTIEYELQKANIDYNRILVSEPLDVALMAYLFKRSKLK